MPAAREAMAALGQGEEMAIAYAIFPQVTLDYIKERDAESAGAVQ